MGHTSPRPFATGVATAAFLIAAFLPVSVPAGTVAPNRAPRISGQPATSVQPGQSYSFSPVASDPDGNRLRFTIQNRPRWLYFDSSTGRLWGRAGSRSRGEHANIRITVSDGYFVAALPPFSITVGGGSTGNRAPVISGSPPQSARVGQSYTFTPTASDPDGQRLTFTIANRPSWASFSSATGTLAGTPATGTNRIYSNISIQVSDGQASAALPSFSITVGTATAANRAPTISGGPVLNAREGQAYAFTPTASDPDGDRLSFTIVNRPSWASFNQSTGALTGTPGPGSVGNYPNITIAVNDGRATAALPAFAISVQQTVLGSASLSWLPPTTRTDGSPLTNLAGFRIRYGTSNGNYPNVIDIRNPGLTRAVVSELPAATWYFVVSAYDATGLESQNTPPVSKIIR